MANSVLSSLQGSSGSNSISLISSLQGATTSFGQSVLTSLRGSSSGATAAPISAGLATTLEPFSIGILSASGPDPEAVSSWAWVQKTGPVVQVVGSGPDRRYLTPATRAGVTVSFEATATFPDGTKSTATVTHTIRGHGGPWRYSGTTLVPVAINRPVLL